MCLDSVFFFSGSVTKHPDHIQSVLGRLSRAGVPVKLNIGFFFVKRINYSGYDIQPGKLGISTNVTDAICGLQPRTEEAELTIFLDLFNALKGLYHVLQA